MGLAEDYAALHDLSQDRRLLATLATVKADVDDLRAQAVALLGEPHRATRTVNAISAHVVADIDNVTVRLSQLYGVLENVRGTTGSDDTRYNATSVAVFEGLFGYPPQNRR